MADIDLLLYFAILKRKGFTYMLTFLEIIKWVFLFILGFGGVVIFALSMLVTTDGAGKQTSKNQLIESLVIVAIYYGLIALIWMLISWIF